MSPVRLSASHYTAGWPDTSSFTVADTNALGIRFAELPEGPAKEDA